MKLAIKLACFLSLSFTLILREVEGNSEVSVKVICERTRQFPWDYVDVIETCSTGRSTNILTQNAIVKNDAIDSATEGIMFVMTSKVHFIPQELKKSFPKLRAIYLQKQPIQRINSTDLEQFGADLLYFRAIGCQIAYLPADLFSHNPNIKYIDFSYNPLEFIEPKFLANVGNLQYLREIDLSKSSCISKVTRNRNDIAAWTQNCVADEDKKKIKVICERTELWKFYFAGEVETCFTGANTKVLTQGQAVENDEIDEKIGAIVLGMKSKVHFIPQGLKKNFPKLQALYIQHQPMKFINSSYLEQFGADLMFFRAIECEISSLPADLFSHNQNLKYIDLSFNPLEIIEPKFLVNVGNLQQLREIDLSNCSCIHQETNRRDEIASWTHNCAAAKLEKVKVVCEEIKEFPVDYLGFIQTCSTGVNTSILTENALVENDSINNEVEAIIFDEASRVHSIPQELKKSFPKLKAIYLLSQPIKSIKSSDLEQFGADLQFLRAIGCQLTHLSADLFSHNPNMKYIDFSRNPLEIIEPGFLVNAGNLEKLKAIDVSDSSCINKMTSDRADISGWTHNCNAEKNGQKSEKVKVVCEQTKPFPWDYVDVIETCSTGVSTNILSENAVVENDAINNEIEGITFVKTSKVHSIPQGLKKSFPKLKAIYLQKQPIQWINSTDLEQFGDDLLYFRAIGCQITYLAADLFSHNPNIKYIDFSYSKLMKFIAPEFLISVGNLEKLKEIDMSDCSCINKVTTNRKEIAEWTHNCNDDGGVMTIT